MNDQQQTPVDEVVQAEEVSALVTLANIRAAVGGTEGRLTNGELVERCRDLCAEVKRLREGVEGCLRENAHLADGDDCTLLALKALLKS